jgi:outer membrane protein assembly factor BamB
MGRTFAALNAHDGSVLWQYTIPDDHEVDVFKASKNGATVVIAHRFWTGAKGASSGDCTFAEPSRDAARILDGAKGQVIASIHGAYYWTCYGYMWKCAVSRDGQWLALVRAMPRSTVLDIQARDGSLVWASPLGGMSVNDFDISMSGRFVTGHGVVVDRNGSLLFDYFPAGRPGGTYFGKVSPDEQYVLVSYYALPPIGEAEGPYELKRELWTTSGHLVWSQLSKVAYIAAISNAAHRIAILEPNGIGVYEAGGQNLFTHDLGFGPWLGVLEITPDSRYLALAVQSGRPFVENPSNPGVGDALGWGSVEDVFQVLDMDAPPENRVIWQATLGDVGIPFVSISDDGSRVAYGGRVGIIASALVPVTSRTNSHSCWRRL